jgi:Cupin domain
VSIFNIFTGDLDVPPDPGDPPGYACSARRVGAAIGATRLGMSIYELPAGQAICPYHFEWTDEEWLIVLAGHATLRTPDGEREVGPGDTVCFPQGPAGAPLRLQQRRGDRACGDSFDEGPRRDRRVPG